jgi:hypothetical protein
MVACWWNCFALHRKVNFITWVTFLGTCLYFTFCGGRSHSAKFETFREITRNLFTCCGLGNEAVSVSVCGCEAVCYVSTSAVLPTNN